MATRYNINDFALGNPAYVGATVSFWTVSGGAKTATLATLYAASTGSTTLTNPRTLDSDGKFSVPVYVEVPVIATVSGLTIADHDTGIMGLAEGSASASATAAAASAAAAAASEAAAAASASPYPSVALGTRFVFVGDSKTDGPTDPTSYPYYFSQLATSDDLGTVYNLGVSGYTLANLITNYTANVKPYRPGGANNLTSIPTVLSIWIGANDLYQLISAGYTDGADYYNDLATYVNTAIADGFRVMMWTIDARGDHVDATTEFYREFINAAIRRNDAATWIVDPETVFWDYTDTVWWNADMIHYNAAGYSRLAKLVAQTLLAAGAPGDLKPPRTNKLNTWTEPQAFTGEVNYVSGAAGTVRGNYLMTALVARFLPHITATAEGGANAGSDYAITSYTDAGAVLTDELLKIKRSTGKLTYKGEASFTGGFGTGAPITTTDAAYTVLATDYAIIANRAGTVTLTLPSAVTFAGRQLLVRTITANTVVSAGSDVVPLAGGAAGTAILAATAGKWALLQSDGTSWQVMAAA